MTAIPYDQLAEYKLEKSAVISAPFSFEPPIALDGVTVFPNVSVGKHSYMNDGMIRSNVKIGRYCSIGRNVLLAAGDHTLECLTTHPVAYRAIRDRTNAPVSRRSEKHIDTIIGHDVWIGNNVVVIGGVHIGTGAVIGANSVVTKDVPAFAIVGGVPAKLIRYRFEADTIQRLLESKWWRLPIAAIESLNVANIDECLGEIESKMNEYGVEEDGFIEFVR
ncbi:MAG: hypothetical protein CMK06_00155 [Ponticaulis sp.]|mgnify:CR=1 FL=1|nr:hypothetical protein [Ponticaulis sp.]